MIARKSGLFFFFSSWTGSTVTASEIHKRDLSGPGPPQRPLNNCHQGPISCSGPEWPGCKTQLDPLLLPSLVIPSTDTGELGEPLTTGTRAARRSTFPLTAESKPNFSAAASDNNSSSSSSSSSLRRARFSSKGSPRYASICLAVVFGQPRGGQDGHNN